MKSLPNIKPNPDKEWFKRVILGQEIPKRPPLIELFLDQEVLREIVVNYLGRQWVEPTREKSDRARYWDNYIEAYYRLGYDFVWIDGKINFPTKSRLTQDTADLSRGQRRWDEEGDGAITNWEEFEKYPWPSMTDFELWDIEYVSKHLYDGMGFFSFPCRGFLEVPLEIIMGYENFCLQLYDDPELVKAVCDRVGSTILSFYRQIAGADNLMGFFPGDDMGYKTSTLISPAALRELILPFHKKAAEIAHQNDYLYLLHSCGNLEEIMPDLIHDVKIDGKHSFEEVIVPVTEFKKKYGDQIAVLGGIDIDNLCRMEEKELRRYVRDTLDVCMQNGRYALGSGNSVANYIPIGNYLAMIDEGFNYGK